MTRRSVLFTGTQEIMVIEEEIPQPKPGEVLVEAVVSAISAGTELLAYRGQFPADMAVDASIEGMAGTFTYPLRYGYSAVGRVVASGNGVNEDWIDRLVFAFHAHSSHFIAKIDDLIPVPEDAAPEQAVFLPNMETAVTLVQDGAPQLGEKTLVLGQGVVGLLTTALLAQFPLESLTTVDDIVLRRKKSAELGASDSLPTTSDLSKFTADLSYEVSGVPRALNTAINATGYGGRVVVGSWYGTKRAEIDLGGHFHRSRIKIISSQVSSIAPALRGRWTKERRFGTAWRMIKSIRPEKLITHQFPVCDAAKAYQLIDQSPDEAIQVLLSYE